MSDSICKTDEGFKRFLYYKCPNCSEGKLKMIVDDVGGSLVYYSNPLQYGYICDKCGYSKIMSTYEDFSNVGV